MTLWVSGGTAPPFLTSPLDESEWSAARSCRFTPRERAHGSHRIEDSVRPRAGLDAVEKMKISYSGRESNPNFSFVSSVYRGLFP
jgi:hypothetical protein